MIRYGRTYKFLNVLRHTSNTHFPIQNWQCNIVQLRHYASNKKFDGSSSGYNCAPKGSKIFDCDAFKSKLKKSFPEIQVPRTPPGKSGECNSQYVPHMRACPRLNPLNSRGGVRNPVQQICRKPNLMEECESTKPCSEMGGKKKRTYKALLFCLIAFTLSSAMLYAFRDKFKGLFGGASYDDESDGSSKEGGRGGGIMGMFGGGAVGKGKTRGGSKGETDDDAGAVGGDADSKKSRGEGKAGKQGGRVGAQSGVVGGIGEGEGGEGGIGGGKEGGSGRDLEARNRELGSISGSGVGGRAGGDSSGKGVGSGDADGVSGKGGKGGVGGGGDSSQVGGGIGGKDSSGQGRGGGQGGEDGGFGKSGAGMGGGGEGGLGAGGGGAGGFRAGAGAGGPGAGGGGAGGLGAGGGGAGRLGAGAGAGGPGAGGGGEGELGAGGTGAGGLGAGGAGAGGPGAGGSGAGELGAGGPGAGGAGAGGLGAGTGAGGLGAGGPGAGGAGAGGSGAGGGGVGGMGSARKGGEGGSGAGGSIGRGGGIGREGGRGMGSGERDDTDVCVTDGSAGKGGKGRLGMNDGEDDDDELDKDLRLGGRGGDGTVALQDGQGGWAVTAAGAGDGTGAGEVTKSGWGWGFGSKKLVPGDEEANVPKYGRCERVIVKHPKKSKSIPSEIPYLLIGGGTSAFSAFRSIKSLDPTAKVLVITDENYFPYMRPPLSKEMWFNKSTEETGKMTFKQWNGSQRSVYFEPDSFYMDTKSLKSSSKGGVAVARGWKVTKIDPFNRQVTLDDGYKITYGKCLIATGSTPKTLPELEGDDEEMKKKVTTYKSIFDFQDLYNVVENPKVKSVTVVGGGFLGSELACALAKHGHDRFQVNQVFKESGNLGKVLPEYLSLWTKDRVVAEGVNVLPDSTVVGASASESGLVLKLSNGQSIETDHCIVAIGSEPNTSLASSGALEVDPKIGGYLVNAELEARSNLYIAGDAACFYDVKLGRRRVEHHDHAVISGRLAGENMVGAGKPYTHQSMFWSDLGPQVGFEAIGVVDSSLPTVGVFAKPTETEDASSTPNNNNSNGREDKSPPTPPEGGSPGAPRPGEEFTKGIVFYMKDDTVVGMVLWNVFNRLHVARQVLRDERKYDDLNEVAKLFNIHED